MLLLSYHQPCQELEGAFPVSQQRKLRLEDIKSRGRGFGPGSRTPKPRLFLLRVSTFSTVKRSTQSLRASMHPGQVHTWLQEMPWGVGGGASSRNVPADPQLTVAVAVVMVLPPRPDQWSPAGEREEVKARGSELSPRGSR